MSTLPWGRGSPNNHGFHSLAAFSLPDILPQSPLQVLSGQFFLLGLPLPTPQGQSYVESVFNISLSIGSCLLKSLSPFPRKSSLVPLSPFSYLPVSPSCVIQVFQESVFDVQSLLPLLSAPDLPTSGLFFKVCLLCIQTQWLPTSLQSCLACRLKMRPNLSQRGMLISFQQMSPQTKQR